MRFRRVIGIAAALCAAGVFAVTAGAEEVYDVEETEGIFDAEEEEAGEIAIDEKNFRDENFRSYVSENFDTDGNGSLSQKEISNVKNIDCSSRRIRFLSGIEYFTELTTLDCSENQIQVLDLSKNTALKELTVKDFGDAKMYLIDLSKNTSLEKFDCSGTLIMDGLDSLKGCIALKEFDCSRCSMGWIDVSENTALTKFVCKDNYLDTLIIGENKSLKYLDCSRRISHETYYNLSELDLSGCTALEYLDCNYNLLPSLDIGGCTALKHLDCGNNQLASLDVSKYTSLEYLYCSGNQLTSLDVTPNTALTYLSCGGNPLGLLDVSKNTALTTLGCYNNQLTSLDVSKNTALTILNCSGNQLTSLDVSKNTALTDFLCYDNQLTSLDVSNNKELVWFWCQDNQLTSLDLTNNLALKDDVLEGLRTDKNITIYGRAGSYAENYAKKYNIKFILAAAPAPSQPATVKSSANMLGATVMCSKVDGATKYRLFYTTDNGKNYTKVGDNKTRKWEVTGLKAGVEYKFLVLASDGKKWSSYKKGDCFAAVTPSPTVKATAGKAKAVVTCSTVSGAKKYRLFYTTDNGKSYKKVGDNKTRKWEVTGLKAGVEYKFLVLAYDGKKWSAYKKGDCYAAVTVK